LDQFVRIIIKIN